MNCKKLIQSRRKLIKALILVTSGLLTILLIIGASLVLTGQTNIEVNYGIWITGIIAFVGFSVFTFICIFKEYVICCKIAFWGNMGLAFTGVKLILCILLNDR